MTIDPMEEAENAWKEHIKAHPLPMVPYFGGFLDAGVFDRDDTVSQIMQIFLRQRENLPAFQKMDPDTAKAMAAVLSDQQSETLAVAHRIHDEIDRRKEAFGLTAAQQAYETTCDAHENALWDLLGYDTVNLAEERARAAAILSEPISREMVTNDERFSDAFLHTVAGIGMPGGEA
jgi:5-formyltetrahydrofolate cyclo-ligase